jgi:hypothetical protein
MVDPTGLEEEEPEREADENSGHAKVDQVRMAVSWLANTTATAVYSVGSGDASASTISAPDDEGYRLVGRGTVGRNTKVRDFFIGRDQNVKIVASATGQIDPKKPPSFKPLKPLLDKLPAPLRGALSLDPSGSIPITILDTFKSGGKVGRSTTEQFWAFQKTHKAITTRFRINGTRSSTVRVGTGATTQFGDYTIWSKP